MTTEFEVAPNICNFILSLRDIGYSLETAVADIIDNSITANAGIIKIFTTQSPFSQTISIVDDGEGMSDDELIEALRLGSRSPYEERKSRDLGRFGLGLKTASFSQCKKLTVFSKKNDNLIGYFWDLDYISTINKWQLQAADIEQFKNFEWYETFVNSSSGTVVVWENIDRFSDDTFSVGIDVLKEHLSLVFHRFLSGEFPGHKISIYVNNRDLKPKNPFPNNSYTQEKPTETKNICGQDVRITPFILPHHSKLSNEQYEEYATKDGYQKSQGFYLYREGRLLIWGTWFGLHRQCEAHKLVRIRIDINNKMDHLWKIDVKKSLASPAPQIRKCLLRIIRKVTGQGFQVYKHRGHIRKNSNYETFWNEQINDGVSRFVLNKDNPAYELIREVLGEDEFRVVSKYLTYIEHFLPIDSMMAKMMDKPKDVKQNDLDINEDAILQDVQEMRNINISDKLIWQLLMNSEIYVGHEVEVQNILKKIIKYD